jgi:hypothetical protein
MAESVDLEQKVAELETRVKKLEIAALVTIIIVFALYIFAKI